MTKEPTEVGGASPLFIVRDVPATLAFYRDKLGFVVTFEGPEPDDIFFGIVERGRAMFMFKDVDIEPIPNHTQNIGHGIAPGMPIFTFLIRMHFFTNSNRAM